MINGSRPQPQLPRIFIGFSEIAGIYSRIVKELRDAGYPISFTETAKHPFGYHRGTDLSDFRFEHRLSRADNRVTSVIPYLIFRTYHLFWALRNFDTFVFIYGRSFLPRNLDLPLLRLLRKRIVSLVGHGSEARPAFIDGAHWSNALKTSDPLQSIHQTFLQQKKHMRRIERSSSLVIAHPLTAQLLRKPAVAGTYIGIPAPDNHNVPVPNQSPDLSQVRVIHSPSDRRAKGSDIISDLVSRTTSDRYNLNYTELHGVSNSEVIAKLVESDIAIDQMYSDTGLGGFGTEAASLGVTVLSGCYGVSELNKSIQQAFLPPALVVHPRDVEEAFKRLLEDRDYRDKIASDCKTFVTSNWSTKNVSERFLLVVNGTFPLDWYFNPMMVSYVNGCGLEESELVKICQSGIARFGKKFVNIHHRPDLYEKIWNLIQNSEINLK
jgi:hypothetical protein